MIGKIAIIPYVTNGRNSQVGHDGYLNIFKKKRSTVLKENIASYIDYGNINKTDCYRLSHEEYEKGDVRKIIEYIKVK